jgi:transcriptional regulator with XRE-family HTH domain
MGFIERLENLIIEKNTKQSVIAEACGIAQNTISGWKKRGTLPQADVAVKLAQELGVTVEYLVTGQDKLDQGFSARQKELLKDIVWLTDTDIEIIYPMIHSVAEKRRDEARTQKTSG